MSYNDDMAEVLLAQHADPDDLAPAFRLMFGRLPAEQREARVANALYLTGRGELQRESVVVARGRRGLVGALVCVPLRGASGLFWPPHVLEGPRQREVEDRLVRFATDWLRRRGAKLAQALLPPDEAALADPLLRNGFAHVTRLLYLRHDLGVLPEEGTGAVPNVVFLPYRAETIDQFHQTLLRTYEATLDCPELNGVRDLAEIIDGHQGQGRHDPEHWWLAEEAGRPVGAVLTAELPDLGGWDLSYVGVVPEARGRGLGGRLTRKALVEARAAGAGCVTLAVDMRNGPAWNMYRRLGFEPAEKREVYLAFF
jgi:ribosomal protein S18 acetylase RimI-like enzyme